MSEQGVPDLPYVPRGTLTVEEVHTLLKRERKPWTCAEMMTPKGPALAVTRLGSMRRLLIRESTDIYQLIEWMNELEAEALGELPPVQHVPAPKIVLSRV